MRLVWVSKLAPQLGLPHVLEHAVRLAHKGYEVTVVSAATRADQPFEEDVRGVRVVALRTAPPPLRTASRVGFMATRLPFYLLAPRYVAKLIDDADVVIEDVAPLWAPELPFVARRHRTPLVYQTHNSYPTAAAWREAYGPAGYAAYLLDQLWQRRLHPAAVFSDAKWTTDALRHLPVPVEWIPNGVDIEHFRPRDDADPRRSDGSIVALCVARFVALKNHRLLLQGLARSPSNVRLRLVGDGPEERALRRLADELGIADRVEFLGHLDRHTVAEAYRDADLFCLPSLVEGQPHSVLEAMASGLPLAMSDIPAANGVVTDAVGWRLSPTSVDAWVDLFAMVSRDAVQLRARGRAARRHAVEGFSWDGSVQVLDRLLRSVVKMSNGRYGLTSSRFEQRR